MAKESGSALGSVIGILIGVILVAGIAGTPFYISMLQTESRGLDQAVDGDVDALRRVVQHLDQNLAAIADAHAIVPDDALTSDDAARFKLPPEPPGVSTLDKTRTLLQDVRLADSERGTDIPGVSLPQGGINPGEAVSAVTRRYQSDNKDLHSKAQQAINDLRQVRFGTVGADQSLPANRAQAIYWTTMAQMHSNRADLEEDLASLLLRQAMWNVDVITTLQLDIEATEAQMPTTTISALREEASKIEDEIAEIQTSAGDLRNRVADLSDDLASAVEDAAEIHAEMNELALTGLEDSIERSSRYLELTKRSNEIESRIATLRDGAAEDADSETIGLRDLEFRLRQEEESIAGWQKALSHFEEQIEKLTATEEELTRLRGDLVSKRRDLAADVEELMTRAEEHQAAAQTARDEAQQALAKARQFAGKAITLAAGREREITQSAPPGDELAEMVRKDGDTKALVQCLAAEVDFTEALLLTKQIQTLSDAYQTRSNIARMIEGETPDDPGATIEALQTEASEKLVSAAKRYEEAANSIKTSSIQTPAGTMSGSNYVWQTNIGLAAVELLRSTLAAAATGSVDTDAQERAYNLLVEAVKDREKSPLLMPAIDVIKYLQHRVAE